MFGWLGKKDKEKKEEQTMTTLEQVRKAYEDLSDDDKKSFHQSIADRVHESIAAQERADGNKDSQSADDREHEALGAEHAAGHGGVSELHEQRREEAQDKRDERQDERHEAAREEADDWRRKTDERFSKIEEQLARLLGGDKLQESREKYGLAGGSAGSARQKEFTDEDVKRLLG